MRKITTIYLVIVLLSGIAYANSESSAVNQSDIGVIVMGPGSPTIDTSAQGGGGTASANNQISTTSVANYESKVPPVPVPAPYLPFTQHGGWGTIDTFFLNGPNGDSMVYARSFNPDDKRQIKDLKSILSLSYDGPLEMISGTLGSLFGKSKTFHLGKGIKIIKSLVRDSRIKGRNLKVIPAFEGVRQKLGEANYISIGRIGAKGNLNRNWDHLYAASVVEALRWDIDVIVVDGGIKGVTVMGNNTFGMAGGYSQKDSSISAMGAIAKGITEGAGRPVFAADAYRYDPGMKERVKISQEFYRKIGLIPAETLQESSPPTEQEQPTIEPQIVPVPISKVNETLDASGS